VNRSEKTFFSYRFKAKQSEKTLISFRFEAKRKIFRSEIKRKNVVLISLWLVAKNPKRKEAKKIFASVCETNLVSL
jgi:hypothetical protein